MNLPIRDEIHEAPAETITMRPIAAAPADGIRSCSKRTSAEPALARPESVSIQACGCSLISLRK